MDEMSDSTPAQDQPKISRQVRRARERRMAKGGYKTFDQSNPAYVEVGGERVEFPPFSTLTAGGITDCAVAIGLYGERERQKRLRSINASVRGKFG